LPATGASQRSRNPGQRALGGAGGFGGATHARDPSGAIRAPTSLSAIPRVAWDEERREEQNGRNCAAPL